MAEVGNIIARGQGPHTLALLQITGVVAHPVGPFNIWGRATPPRSSGPRPSIRPSPRPMMTIEDDDADPTCEDEHENEYVEVVVDDEELADGGGGDCEEEEPVDGMDFPETAGTDLDALASSPVSGGVVAGDEISEGAVVESWMRRERVPGKGPGHC